LRIVDENVKPAAGDLGNLGVGRPYALGVGHVQGHGRHAGLVHASEDLGATGGGDDKQAFFDLSGLSYKHSPVLRNKPRA